MKKKITAVLLCLALLLTLSVSVSADTSTANIQPLTDTQITPITDEVTVNVGENDVEIIESEISDENTIMPLAQTSGIVSGGIYQIKNVASGKYMNVDCGTDANGTNIYQWTGDGSTEQKFRVVYSSSTDSYMFYAMCSSNGTNRVVDVTRGGSPLTSGQNIKLYNPTDPTSQEIKIVSLGSNNYKLVMNANQNLAVTSYGTSNGSTGGTTSTSAGNIFISTYTGSTNQQWQFELLENPNASSTPIGYLDSVTDTAISGWAYQANVPNRWLEIHIYITNQSTGDSSLVVAQANLYRDDLEAAGYGNGYHGFRYNISWLSYVPGTYTVSAYAIGINSSNAALTYSPKSFTVRSVEGNVDIIAATYIQGWVYKPDAPNEPLEVHAYVYRSNGDLYGIYTATANRYRSDLYNAGIGNGEHGFIIDVDFNSMPEERFTVELHYVDGSGYHPMFHTGYYDNRMPITLLGMVDGKGIDHSTWMWNDSVVTHCENIGCSQLNRYNCADAMNQNYSYSRFIRESSFCAIATHGCKTGIQWSMRNIYNGHDNCDDTCSTCFGMYDTSILNALPDNYFADTRCVVSIACETAKGGKTDLTNFVNVLQSKGVETVVGFEEETWFFYNTSTLQTITTKGSFKWLIEFARLLGEGYTIGEAASNAYDITITANLEANGDYTEYDLDNDLIPEDIKTKEILCGLHTYCIVGDENQIVKH